MSLLCSQCGAAATRCDHCGVAVCARRFCVELHEAACAAVTSLPAQPADASFPYPANTDLTYPRRSPRRRERNPEAERALAEQLMFTIGHHRHVGRTALLAGDLDTAFDELWAARQLEPDLDRLGADARAHLPADWELETDLVPLARALAAHHHPRAGDAWRRLLEDGAARSIQAEAAEWLATDAAHHGQLRASLRALHAASALGRPTPPDAFAALYRAAGLDPTAAFGLYLTASRLDAGSARAVVLRDPLTEQAWPDQDPRWWYLRGPALLAPAESLGAHTTEHQSEALGRARDLAVAQRDQGWLLLAEGDFAAGPLGVRALGRNVRAGLTEPADEDAFVRIRLAYEGAAERLPDVAWPWYRLAELLAWAGFGQAAANHLAEAERRGLGNGAAERANRPLLRALVQAGLGNGPASVAMAARPFPAEPFRAATSWRRFFR